MIGKKMAEAIDEQINHEMYSAYLYLAMSAESANLGWNGFAKWFMVQYHEEMFHAMKFYNFLVDRGAKPELRPLKAPPAAFGTPKVMFEQTYEHEQFITSRIHALAELAQSEKDHAAYKLLQWYVDEQVEEEKNDTEILAQLKLIGDNPAALFMLDAQLKARTVAVATDYSVPGAFAAPAV